MVLSRFMGKDLMEPRTITDDSSRIKDAAGEICVANEDFPTAGSGEKIDHRAAGVLMVNREAADALDGVEIRLPRDIQRPPGPGREMKRLPGQTLGQILAQASRHPGYRNQQKRHCSHGITPHRGSYPLRAD
jgi:hypothetical protein